MPRITLFLLAAALAGAQPVAASAATSVCRTVNGSTVCAQSGESLSCQTVNGQTHCLRGSGSLRCETINGRTACSSTQSATPPPTLVLPDEDEEGDEPEIKPAPPDPDRWGRDLSVLRDGAGLRVRAGTLDLRLGRFP